MPWPPRLSDEKETKRKPWKPESGKRRAESGKRKESHREISMRMSARSFNVGKMRETETWRDMEGRLNEDGPLDARDASQTPGIFCLSRDETARPALLA